MCVYNGLYSQNIIIQRQRKKKKKKTSCKINCQWKYCNDQLVKNMLVYCAWVCLVCCRSGVSLSLWLSSSLITQHSQELICQQAAPVTHTINSLRTESEQTNTHTPKCVHTRLKTLAYTSIHTHTLSANLVANSETHSKANQANCTLANLKTRYTTKQAPTHTRAHTHTSKATLLIPTQSLTPAPPLHMHEWPCTPTIHHIPRLLLNRPSPLPLSSSKWVSQSSACHLSLCWWCPASIYCLLIDRWTLQMLRFTWFSCWRDITALPIPALRKVIC